MWEGERGVIAATPGWDGEDDEMRTTASRKGKSLEKLCGAADAEPEKEGRIDC